MDTFIQIAVSGVALGFLYALVSLSFVVLLKATGHFNLLPGSFVLLGAYTTYQLHQNAGLNFWISLALAIVIIAAIGLVIHYVIFQRIDRRASSHAAGLAILLITIGLLSLSQAAAVSSWGADVLLLGDPWGLSTLRIGNVSISERDIAAIVLSLVVLLIFWVVFQRTRIGVGMRALASDHQAAFVQGISPRQIAPYAWLMSAGAAVIAGVLMATEAGGGLRPTLDVVAFTALPALILGGIRSLPGCVAGGLVLGVVQQLALGYAPASFGQGFSTVLPWIIMIVVLLVRPSGLFATREFRRA
jgi:branched-chain amino acid transport system permease protein